DDRYGECVLPECHGGRVGGGENYVGLQVDQFLGQRRRSRRVAAEPTVVDLGVLALPPAQFSKSCCERRCPGPLLGIAFGLRHEHANVPHPLGLLRACRERPSSYTAAEECDEFPPPHGADPKAKDHGTKYSRCWGGSVARIAIKSGASARRAEPLAEVAAPKSYSAAVQIEPRVHVGYSNSRRGRAVSAARRERFAERALWNIGATRMALFGLDVGRPDHLAPLLGFVGDELAKVGGR